MTAVFENVWPGNLHVKNRLIRSSTRAGIAQPDGGVAIASFFCG